MQWRMRSQNRPTGPKRVILRRVFDLFRPYRWLALLLVGMIALDSAFGLVPALIIKRVIDAITAPTAGSMGRVNQLFAVLVATIVCDGLLGVALGFVNQTIGQGIMYRLRSDLHQHLQALSIRFFTQTRTGEILSRVSTDVNGVQEAVTGTFTDFISNALTLILALALMFSLHWQLTLFALVVLPLWVYPTMKIGQVMRRLMREYH